MEGHDNAWLFNQQDTRLFWMDVESCNPETDVAVLKRTIDTEIDSEFSFTEIKGKSPRQGTALYGPGHPLMMPLVIKTGHYQHKIQDPRAGLNDAHIITVPTIPGDSGSPVIGLENREVVIYGIRVAVRVYSTWSLRQILPDLTIMTSGHNILIELHD